VFPISILMTECLLINFLHIFITACCDQQTLLIRTTVMSSYGYPLQILFTETLHI
jgi:hypothetical protein